jgi:2,4-dichlorophenol 6-monooxygenase
MVTALLLRRSGIESLVVERRDGQSALPKAHIINQRSVEILGEAGVLAQVQAVASPHENMVSVDWYTSFAGPSALHGREVGRIDAWGGGAQLAEHEAASPYHTTNLSRMKLEPILLAELKRTAPGGVLLGHEIRDYRDLGDRVRAHIWDRATGREFIVEADYLVGADGGRTVAAPAGIEMVGQRDLVKMISAHISVELSELNPNPGASTYWFVNPDKGGSLDSGNMVVGGRGWGADADEWVFNLGKAVDDPVDVPDSYFVEHVRRAVGVTDLDVKVHRISQWTIESVIATRFGQGRVYLVGDSAHRHPPTGAGRLVAACSTRTNVSAAGRRALLRALIGGIA